MVVSLSKHIKEYGAAHPLSAQLRADAAKLTNATQEFVMFMGVSSYGPPSTRPHSPMQPINTSNTTTTSSSLAPPSASASTNSQPSSASSAQPPPSSGDLTPPDDHLKDGNAGLSRSRSAQATPSTKVVSNSASLAPKSALPHQQAFKLPATPGLANGGLWPNGGSRLRNDSAASLRPEPLHLHAHANGL